MGEVTMNSSSLLPKISLLYNNPLFSDVEFVFASGPGHNQKIYGHKLILALRSKAFAYTFYEKKDSISLIELPAAKKSSFELLFRFLYTDDVQFHTFEEAQELYNLANTYDIKELCEKCHNYMLQEKLTAANIFSRYECALNKNVWMLLKDCRDFVCSHTQLILKSKNFTNASPEVIEDIIKQDHLSVSSELEVITAVLNWGAEDLKKKNMPCDEKHIRDSINEFMKYLRFLTLSPSEFDDFVEHHNVLSAKESSVLTRKILQPECNVNLPKDICSIVNKRRMVFPNNNSHFNENRLDSKCIKMPKSDSSKFNVPESAEYFKDHLKSTLQELEEKSKSISQVSPKPLLITSKTAVSHCQELPTNRISYEVKKCTTFKEHKGPSPQIKQNFDKEKFRSSPNIWPPSPLSSVSRSPPREYSFPLREIPPCLKMSFRKDIKCSVIFKMKSGNIFLRGFELKIKNKNDETDELEAFVHMTGFSESISKFYEKKLHNSTFTVMFNKPMILKEGNKGELEVSIDNLSLDRCSICYNYDGQTFEMNNGLEFGVEFCLKSNQKNDDFLFLISKLFF